MSPEQAGAGATTGVRFRAMGTEVLVVAPPHDAERAARAVEALFAEWESTLSRFRPESELSALNAAAGRPVAVSELLFRTVETALEGARATGGLFDPALLHELRRIGYDRPFAELRGEARASHARPSGGGSWRRIELDRAGRRITLPPGCALDLGGIAKGLAVDAALGRLAALGVDAALVSAGGDLAVRGLPPQRRSWPVALAEDGDRVVTLVRGALATSGVGRRSWRQGSLGRHHLVDPRTGEPAWSGLRAVTVAAGTCAQAEVAATAAFVLGVRLGADLVRRNGLAALFVTRDGVRRAAGPWPGPLEGLAA